MWKDNKGWIFFNEESFVMDYRLGQKQQFKVDR